MSVGPGAMGLLWLWASVAQLGPGDHPGPHPAPRPIVIMTYGGP